MEINNENFLTTWIRLTAAVWNKRLVEEMSYNEAVVCNLILKQEAECPEKPYLMVRDLCEYTSLHKSQMNKVLSSLEEHGLVERIRGVEDRRVVYVRLCEAGRKIYTRSHANTLKYVDAIMEHIGVEGTQRAMRAFSEIADAVNAIRKSEIKAATQAEPEK